MKETLLDKLNKANDAYHEAVNDILSDGSLDVEQKAKIGTNAHTIFEGMKILKGKCEIMYAKE